MVDVRAAGFLEAPIVGQADMMLRRAKGTGDSQWTLVELMAYAPVKGRVDRVLGRES
jgi:hypothetical protein